jgi:hypothetical protein
MPRPPLTPRESALEIIAYYEQQLARDPDNEESGLGLEMARWWQRLLQMPDPPKEEINRLVMALYAKRREMGGRWFDLSGRVEKWKRELALRPRPTPAESAVPSGATDESDMTDEPDATDESDATDMSDH